MPTKFLNSYRRKVVIINKECEEGGSNNEPKANKMQAEIKNQWFTLSKPFENFKFPVNLYAKCTLNKRMNSLTFKEGDLVERLEGTCFRVGYEVYTSVPQK